MQLNSQFLRETLDGVSMHGGVIPADALLSIDAHTICAGEVFVAVSGAHHDGHDFVLEACSKGIAGLVIENRRRSVLDAIDAAVLKKMFVVMVDNSFDTLIEWARSWRKHFSYPVIAITGTVGKTGTKEILASMLALHKKRLLIARGDNNTMLGIALAILRMRLDHDLALFEIDISKREEMMRIVDLLRPTSGIITNIGHQHMDGLGSLNDIAAEQRKVFHFFAANNIGIINGDQSLLADIAYPHPVIKFGSKTTNQVQVRKLHVTGSHISFILKIYNERYPVMIAPPHEGIVFNIAAAAAAAYLCGVPLALIAQVASCPPIIAGRFESRELCGNSSIIINDCDNASPESLKAALIALQRIETEGVKVAVIGDMIDLGVHAAFWHRQIGRFLYKIPSLKRLILVGNLVQWTKKTAPRGIEIDLVKTWQEAYALLTPDAVQGNHTILVKGSRALGFDQLVVQLTESKLKAVQ